MARKPSIADLTPEQQREITSESLPLGQMVTTAVRQYKDPRTGVVAKVGVIDASRAPRGMASDPLFDNLKEAMYRRLDRTGVDAATIINMLPLPLIVNSPMGSIKNVIVPACSPGQEFTSHTWDEVYIDNMLSGEGTKTPWDFHPIQMVDAFVEEYRPMGGVVGFIGTLADYDLEQDIALRSAVEDAKSRMFVYGQEVLRDAESLWHHQNSAMKNAIVDKHRLFAQMLFDHRRLNKLPEWMKFERNDLDISTVCPVCKAEPKKGAAICTTAGCGYVLDPAAAFELKIIDEQSPVLERLTRVQVEEMGISAYVAETSDERKGRLALGLQKPLSQFEQKLASQEAAA